MKLGEQWIEVIDGKLHMVKAALGKSCQGCANAKFGENDFSFNCVLGMNRCPFDTYGLVIKDLGILKDGLLPCPFCGEYTEILKGKLGYRIRHVCRDSYVMAGTGIYETKQEAIDAWNGRS